MAKIYQEKFAFITNDMKKKCLICKSKSLKIVCKSGGFVFRECKECGLIFLANPPSRKFLDKFYAYDDEKRQNKESFKLNPLNNFFLRNKFLAKLVNFWGITINQFWATDINNLSKKKGKILDIGCGVGIFLSEMKKRGWNVNGIEVGGEVVKAASAKVGHGRIFREDSGKVYKRLKGKKYDVISLWHVFEHLSEIDDTLEKIVKLLKRKGTLVIEVPNSESFNFKIFRGNWTFLMPPQHLHFWSRESFEILLKKHNLEIITTLYPAYFAFVFSSSFIKKYPQLFFLVPLLTIPRIYKRHSF